MIKSITINNQEYRIDKSSEIIEGEAKNGGKKYWQAHVLRKANIRTNHAYYTATSSWHDIEGGTSKVMWSEPFFAHATNVGRANQRLNPEQADFEFESMVKKQKDKRNSVRPLPMLAQKFKERGQYLTYPCVISPKLDGFRVCYDGREAWTRGSKLVNEKVFEHLQFDTRGYVVDGELILPGNRPVNETRSAGTKFQAGLSDTLEYHLFDIIDETLPYTERLMILADLVGHAKNSHIKLVSVERVECEGQIDELHNKFVQQGYEGSILRNVDSFYEINKRSNDLLKYKDFLEEDFEVIDVIPAGGGSSAHVGKFVCIDKNGNEFEATAMGSEEQRREYLKHKKKYIRKMAKIKFIGYSGKKKVPYHANCLEVRDKEEI